MPRQARLLLGHSYYHVMTRGNNKHIVFHDAADYHHYLELLGRFKAEHPFELYHYCLMPNHVHMLIQTDIASGFATFMKKLNLSYAQAYAKRYGWVGHFWQDRYKSQPVGKDSYFIQCGKYIELNPVRSGLTRNPADYPYSSYRAYTLGEPNLLLTPDLFYQGLGESPTQRAQNYQDLVISDQIASSYQKPTWGALYQRKIEQQKRRYHLRIRQKKDYSE
ncbi:MAG: transposase [Patescibacteria group bacterium]